LNLLIAAKITEDLLHYYIFIYIFINTFPIKNWGLSTD